MSVVADRPPKAFSCIRCFERKVKCDKQHPCSNCVKSKVECIFRVPPAPRRRKKRPPEEMLLARLKKCEELLKNMGVDVDSGSTPTISPPAAATEAPTAASQVHSRPPAFSQQEFFAEATAKSGQLIVDHGKSRFIENNLWTSVSTEVNCPNSLIQGACWNDYN